MIGSDASGLFGFRQSFEKGQGMLKRMIPAIALAAAISTEAWAVTPEEIASEVEKQATSTIEAVEMLRKAMIAVSQRGTFAFRKAMFVAAPPDGFGIYTEHLSGKFKSGEPIYVYLEPVGLKWVERDGIYHSSATIDYEVRSPDGKVLLGQRDVGRMAFNSRDQNQEIMYQFSLNLEGARPGDYILSISYREESSNQTATVELPFKIE